MTAIAFDEDGWRAYQIQELIDDLGESIARIHALSEIAIGSDIQNIKPATMLNYWGLLNDLTCSAKRLCEELNDAA